jgi:hypothetical protein
MRHPLLPILLVGLALSLAPLALGQEVLPPEDRDTIQPKPDEPKTVDGKKASASEEHTVLNGDTLWDLCGRYLNNPWYWPRVWSYNPEISNPHWIYPGQVVRFYPGGEGPGEIDIISRDLDIPEPSDISLEDEYIPAEDLVSVSGRIAQVGSGTSVQILRSAFITRKQLEEMGTIRASREEKELLSEGDTAYLDFKNLSGVKVGDRFTVYRNEAKINHPVTGEFVGHYTLVVGVLQVINIAETSAVVRVVTSTDGLERGDLVGPMMDNLTKEVGPRPNEVELRGYILGAAVTQLSFYGERHMVFIDQGTEQGVQEGNLFDVVRREDGLFMPGRGRKEGTWDKSMPAEIWGRVMVVDARPAASTGLIVDSIRELRAGDRVMMRLK